MSFKVHLVFDVAITQQTMPPIRLDSLDFLLKFECALKSLRKYNRVVVSAFNPHDEMISIISSTASRRYCDCALRNSFHVLSPRPKCHT